MKFEPHSFADGAVAIREGDLADRFYVVESGRVAVTREGRPLGELGPGDVFGEIALTIGGVRTATVTTVGKVAVRSLSKADFDDALAAYCGRAGELERLSHLRLEAQRAAPSP